ncbi:MAG TPA: MarR family transcriptional regulator [Spirochaetia bacterium]|nr:MarR family transcriptional regulator [Spirochaetia bacterium]
MGSQEQAEMQALMAARDLGIGTMLFRNSLAKALEVNLTESLCLTLLGIRNELSPTVLARYMGLSTGATTTLLDRLENRGLVTRVANPKDRRGIHIALTPEYQRRAQGLVVGVQKAHRDLISRYSEAQLAVITDFLQRFTGNLAQNSDDVLDLFGPSLPSLPAVSSPRE